MIYTIAKNARSRIAIHAQMERIRAQLANTGGFMIQLRMFARVSMRNARIQLLTRVVVNASHAMSDAQIAKTSTTAMNALPATSNPSRISKMVRDQRASNVKIIAWNARCERIYAQNAAQIRSYLKTDVSNDATNFNSKMIKMNANNALGTAIAVLVRHNAQNATTTISKIWFKAIANLGAPLANTQNMKKY